MKQRLRKKAYRCACLFEGDDFLVTDDPYPIYNREFYCTIGKFNWTWGNHCDEELPCENCKAFKLSRRTVREKRENDKRAKKVNNSTITSKEMPKDSELVLTIILTDIMI